MNEEVILLQAKEGHEDAFRKIYKNHRERIYRLAYRYTRSIQDAEDIMQETFIKAFKSIQMFKNFNNSSFTAWLNRICINCAINYLRKMKRRKMNQVYSLSEMVIEPESQDVSPETSAQTEQILRLIQRAIQKLSPKQRIIFDMRYAQHWNIKEIAQTMDCSESNIKTQLFRSVAKLRKQLGPLWEER